MMDGQKNIKLFAKLLFGGVKTKIENPAFYGINNRGTVDFAAAPHPSPSSPILLHSWSYAKFHW